jgi:hypothetical protein
MQLQSLHFYGKRKLRIQKLTQHHQNYTVEVMEFSGGNACASCSDSQISNSRELLNVGLLRCPFFFAFRWAMQ